MSSNEPLGPPPSRPEFNPYDAQGYPRSSRWGLSVQLVLLVAGALIILRLVWVYWIDPPAERAQAKAAAKSEPEKKSDKPGDWQEEAKAIANKAALETARAKVALARTQQQEFINRAKELKKRLDEWQKEVAGWNDLVTPLLTDERGKVLAADPSLLKEFRAVSEQQRPDPTRIAEVRALAAELARPIEEANRDPDNGATPDVAAQARLDAFVAEARQSAESYRKGRLDIELLLEDAKLKGLKGDKTLQQAIVAQQRDEQRAAITQAQRQLEEARKEADQQRNAAEREAIRIAGETEARRIMEAAKLAQEKQKLAEDKQQKELAKTKRLAEMEREMPDIQKYLRPFITKGYAQPNGFATAQGTEATPMSLSRMAAGGALRDSREGMEQLLRYANSIYGNDRDKGGFPEFMGGDASWQRVDKAFVKRAQELLNRYGDLMVEKGLLSQ